METEDGILERIRTMSYVIQKRIEESRKDTVNYQDTSDNSSSESFREAEILYQDDTSKILSAKFERIDKGENAVKVRQQGCFKYCYMILHYCVYQVLLMILRRKSV